LGGWKVALLLNFNVAILKAGIERLVLGLEEEGTPDVAQKPAATLPDHPKADRSLCSPRNSGDEKSEHVGRAIVDAAIEVHRELGPGLLRSAYTECLCHELQLRGLAFERRRRLPLCYKRTLLAESDEVELLVGGRVVVSPCALGELRPVDEAQLLSQLRLGGWNLGFLMNFNTVVLKEGLHRVVLSQRT
jgi:GxxExxY protein